MAFTFNIPGTVLSGGDLLYNIPIGLSPLGTVIVDDITFPAGRYEDKNGNLIEFKEISLQSVQVTVNQAKNIVKTKVSGRESSIKTFMSNSDYSISVTGVLSELFDVFPYDQINRLNKVESAPISVKIINKFLNSIFGIFDVVITDYHTSTIPGSGNSVNFSLTMLSEKPFNYKDFEILL